MSNPNDGQQAPPPLSGYDEMRRVNRENSGHVDCEFFLSGKVNGRSH